MPLIYGGSIEEPIEIMPGGGDLRFSSVPLPTGFGANPNMRSLELAGDRVISFWRLYESQPMLGAVVGWLQRQSVRVPLKAYRRTGDDSRERLRPGDHRVADLITTPWERASQIDLTTELLGSLSVHGNGLGEIDEGADGKLQLTPVDWRYATPVYAWRGRIGGWRIDDDDPSTDMEVPIDRMLHVAWWAPSGPIGISPLKQLAVSMNIEDAAQRHQKSMLANGAKSPVAITISDSFLGLGDQEMRQEALANLRTDTDTLYSGPDNNRPWLLPPGLDAKAVPGQTALEAALIEQRLVVRSEACAVYGVLPAALGLADKSAASIQDARSASVLDALAPALILIEEALNAQLIRGLLREDDVFVEYDFGGILRGDKLKEVEAIREAIGTAVMTPNEARATLNMPKSDLPGMNEFYLPRNNDWPVRLPYPDDGMGAGDSDGGPGVRADDPTPAAAEPVPAT